MQFNTQYGESRPKGSKETFTKPSQTEPDNSMSIPEIIARYTRGQGIAVKQYTPEYGHAAPEENEGTPSDATFTAVLGIEESAPAAPVLGAAPAPAAPAQGAAPALPASPGSPAPAEPSGPAAPAPAPAGA